LKRLVFLLLVFVLQAVRAEEEKSIDLNTKSRLILEARELRHDSAFGPGLQLTSFGKDRGRFEEEVRGKAGPFSLLLTGVAAFQEGQRPNARLVSNEVYADFALDKNHFTVGTKILSGDVGYGFRPIDVIQREQRLQVLPPALVGVPVLAWERFTADEAWSLIYANPGHRQRSDPKADGSVAARYYTKVGKTDIHAVARASDRYKLEAGAAFSSVPHESVELHGSALFIDRDSRTKALAGFTWTFENGFSLLGEAWWDGAAPSAQDWKNLNTRAKLLQNNAPALAGLTRMFAAPGYARRNALARIAWTDPAGSGWSASFDMLRTLDDRGYAATAAIAYDADRLRLDAGLRRFGGRPDAAYRLLPERGVLFAGVSLAF
jgi:hypothetical protein